MKKIISVLLSLAMLLCAAGCSGTQQESSEGAQTAAAENASPTMLTNRMTDTERGRVSKHALTLLDEPEEPSPEPTEHKVSVEFKSFSCDQLRENLENERNHMTDADYEDALAYIKGFEDKGETMISLMPYILVDGKLCTEYIPYTDESYDGGSFSYIESSYDPETDQMKKEEHSFESCDEYIAWIKPHYIELGYPVKQAECIAAAAKAACEALKSGNYETLPAGTVDPSDTSLMARYLAEDSGDYRDVWEYNRDAVEAIKDSVEEISIYDEELDTEFLVHVTLPPHYDAEKTYPVYFLTDGVWRFGNVPQLRSCMEQGLAADVLLVTLGFAYDHDGTDLGYRYSILVQERCKLLDFITDNLMPYLGENYHIDYAASTLYGHSDGGVFAHTALCKADLYANQPFGSYIIGSPAFWGLYYDYPDLDAEGCETDYGVFDRNHTLGKRVFLCGGAQEDPDYADSYDGHATTLEGLAALRDRLTARGTDVTYKLYDSHHYQYIPEMLEEYLKAAYPPKN